MRIFRRGFWQFGRLFWEIISSLVNSLKSFWRGRGLPEDNFLVKVRRVWRFAWKRIFVYATFWHLAKESLSWSRTVGRFSWKEVFFAVILKNIIRRKESFLKDSLETVLFWVDIECWKKKISSKKRKDWKQWLFKKKKITSDFDLIAFQEWVMLVSLPISIHIYHTDIIIVLWFKPKLWCIVSICFLVSFFFLFIISSNMTKDKLLTNDLWSILFQRNNIFKPDFCLLLNR